MGSQLFDLTSRVAVVTGAGSGLGKAIAAGLAEAGADIVAADINQPSLHATVAQVMAAGRRALAVQCDVSQDDSVEALFAETDRGFGRVDILVNCAGITSHTPPEQLSREEWERVLGINLTGYFLCAQAACRRMQRQGGGSIINISSIAGSSALGRSTCAYGVSKGAVNQLTRELAVEWAKYHIRVNAIQPCHIRTPLLQAVLDKPQFDSNSLAQKILRGIPMNRLGEPADVVGPVIFLASSAAALVTGVLLPVDGGNLALNPSGSFDN